MEKGKEERLIELIVIRRILKSLSFPFLVHIPLLFTPEGMYNPVQPTDIKVRVVQRLTGEGFNKLDEHTERVFEELMERTA